jgi:hypothetical protein
MTIELLFYLSVTVFVVALLYSCVGHAGASGYIAVMTLFNLDSSMIKPAALMLNILVASIASWQFWKAGHFSLKLFLPFAAASVPFAFLGGYINLPISVFKIIIGLILLYSAGRFFIKPNDVEEPHSPKKESAFSVGAGIGFFSGLTGVGGGIFLTPIVIVMKWARTKTASAISASFILVNSISGLAGNMTSTKNLPFFVLPLAVSAVVGGSIGSFYGSQRFSPVIAKKILAIVLIVAGTNLIFFDINLQ